jgi:ATP-dependent DNA helicase RecG
VIKHINKEVIIGEKLRNTQKWQYPIEALREIILNMIVHRDYRSSADSIVKVFDHKIEFFNPGRLPENITVEDLLSNNYKSTPRNKLIADFCKTIGLIEKYGSGIRRILFYCQADGLASPLFQNISDGFSVTIYDKEYSQTTTHDLENATVNVIEKKVSNPNPQRHNQLLESLKANAVLTIPELARLSGVAQRTIARDLEILKNAGFLKRIGPDKGGRWEVQSPK